ncbi:WD40-repeat-containing domain protein [Gongronella butleri]|nr:WD40-repeat-containing domain protein [Gongronella butleri]
MSADQQWMVSTLNENIIVTEMATGQQIHDLEGDTEIVTTLAIQPNGQHIISASRSLTLRVWDRDTGKCVRSMNKAHEAPIIVMAIDPTSTLVATGGADGTVKIWDIEKGFCTHHLRGHAGVISAVKFHQYKNKWYLASGADDCVVRVWDLQSRKTVSVLKSHTSVIRGLDFSADGKVLISGSRDRVVNVWDWQQQKLKATIPVFETLEVVGFVNQKADFSAYDKQSTSDVFFTGGDKGTLRLWDLGTGKLIKEQAQELNSKHSISDVIYSPHSQQLVVITNDQNILFYSVADELKRVKQVVGYNDEVVSVVYLGQDETHLAAATNSEQLRVYDIETQNCDLVYGHKDMILCLDRNKQGDVLVTGSKDKTARVWKVDFSKADAEQRYMCVGQCVGHTESVSAVGFARKSNQFMITGGSDRTIKYWNLRDLNFDRATNDIPHAKALYTHQAHDKDINTINVAPNDRVFATGSQDKLAKVWSVDTGELLGTCKGHKRGVWCVRFSNAEQVLATSSGDKTIKIWSLKDFSCLKTFEGHSNSVLSVDFMTAGLQLVSAGSDGLLKVWTIKTNECVGTLDNHTEKVWSMAVRKDEKFIASGGADSVINFWEDVTLQEQEDELREKEAFILKEQELQTYMKKKDYLNAILLAMSLNQPFRLLGLFREVMETRPDDDVTSISGSPAVDTILAEMPSEHLEKLLTYIRDWNTNAKHANVAQTILHAILSSHPPDQLVELASAKEIVDSLLPYTDRHYQRLDNLITQSYIIDYTLNSQL